MKTSDSQRNITKTLLSSIQIESFIAGLIIVSSLGCGNNRSNLNEAYIAKVYSGSHDKPYEFIVKNDSFGPSAMTEIRALNGAGANSVPCAVDLGVTGANWNLPGDKTLQKNEAFLVGESSCNGLHIKSNNGALRLSTVSDHDLLKTFVLRRGKIRFPVSESCGIKMKKPEAGGVLCVSTDGEFYFATPKKIKRL